MTIKMRRRDWLRTGVLAAAGMTLTRDAPASRPARSADGHDLILLDQNENPYGISSRTEKAILEALGHCHRYPGDEMRNLRKLVSEREGIPEDHVILGAGSTEILSLVALAYGADGREVVAADPTYSGFANYIPRVKGRLVQVRLNDRFEHDLNGMAKRLNGRVRLVYVCNPNNPTGTIVDGAALKSFCESAAQRSLVFVDEAYHYLVEDPRYSSMLGLVREGRNVLVARTLSKIHGLAGMRVGFGVARPDIIENLRRIQTNFAPISIVSLAAGAAAYQDTEFIDSCRIRVEETRAWFAGALEKLGRNCIRSHTNFVLFEVGRKPALVVEELTAKRIAVRAFEFWGRNWIRVSLGTMEEMKQLAAALTQVAL